MKDRVFYIFLLLFFFVPAFSQLNAIVITEIMYDHEGTDTKKEWIEIYNDTWDDINITALKLNEAETNHKINEYRGGKVLSSGEYAIIADSPADIISEIGEGAIFDSVFSLSNAGELLSLFDSSGTEIDSVFYDPTIGGKGNGESLQKINGIWISSIQTPGEQNFKNNIIENEDGDSDVATSTLPLNVLETLKEKREPFNIEVEVPSEIFVGEGTYFKAEGFDSFGDLLPFTKFYWSFGDGLSGEGSEIIHTFSDTGNFIVFVNAESSPYTDTFKKTIQVRSVPISILNVATNGISKVDIVNNSSFEFNISGYALVSKGNSYFLPKHTLMIPKGKITISEKVTGFKIYEDVSLLSPYGNYILQNNIKEDLKKEQIVTKTAVQKTMVAEKVESKVIEPNETKSNFSNNQAGIKNSVNNKSQFMLISMLIFGLSVGLVLLYFLQKKHNVIDEVEITSE